VVIFHELDGSGKAINPKVVDSKPAGLIDNVAMDLLRDSEFKTGVKEHQCTWISTIGFVPYSPY
jgi:hypothetical protein